MTAGFGVKGQSASRSSGHDIAYFAGFVFHANAASAITDSTDRNKLQFAAETLDKQNQVVTAKDIRDFANTWNIDIRRVGRMLSE